MLRFVNLLLILNFLVVFPPCRAEANQTVFAVQSLEAKPYEEALSGLETELGPEVSLRRLILSDYSYEKAVDVIRAASPDLVLAIGMQAVTMAKRLGKIPVVYVMVLEDAIDTSSAPNRMTGISMTIEPERQLAILLDVLPCTQTIGILYDPGRTSATIHRLRSAAAQRHISLNARQVYRTRNVPLSAMEMMGTIDAFWMLPDLTVANPEAVEFLFLSAMESRRPVVTFSEKYVQLGALLAISVDSHDMGRQAGEMARKILDGTPVSVIPPAYARKAVLTINQNVADKLGIRIDDSIMKKARIVK